MILIKKIFFFISIFVISYTNYSQDKISLKDSLSIIKVMNLQEIAWNNGDIDSFMKGYIQSDDLVFSGKNGPVYGWYNTKKRYYSSYQNTKIMGKLKFSVKKIKLISENSAYLIGEYYLKRAIDDSYGHFTLIWKKINNNWLIISDHTSAAK